MITREDLKAKIDTELRAQGYGYTNAQPSRKGLASALTHILWPLLAEAHAIEAVAEQQREIRELSEQRRNLKDGAA